MKPLTISERSQISDSLNMAKDSEIRKINANHPGWNDKIEARKRKVAIGRLGIARLVDDLEAVEESMRKLESRRTDIEIKIRVKMPLEVLQSHRYGSCPDHKQMCQAIADITSEVHDQEMKKDAVGKLVLAAELKYQKKRRDLLSCNTRDDVVAKQVFDV